MYSVRLQNRAPTNPELLQFAPLVGVGSAVQLGQPSWTIFLRYALTLRFTKALASFRATTPLCHATQNGPSNFVGPTGLPIVTYPGTV
jgi:hypothetical protein